MGKVLKNVEPKVVFEIFEEICSIPHPSGSTDKISDYYVEFGKKLGLKSYKDEFNNVFIFKPASKGYEKVKPVILQAHIDMVPDKDKSSKHDFLKDPIKISVADGFIKANHTTLGGDDGIGVAFALAILKENAPSPAIEVLLTSDEEVGMVGAVNADLSKLKGEYLINIDSEIEGEFILGCAGGVRVESKLPVQYEDVFGKAYTLEISGLTGGHSGLQIHKNRSNANVLMGLILKELNNEFGIGLIDFWGGKADNVICNYSYATLIIDEEKTVIESFLKKLQRELRKEFIVSDNKITLKISDANLKGKNAKTLSKESLENVLLYLNCVPNGILNREQSNSANVETSLNLGMIRLEEDFATFCHLVRSSFNEKKYRIVDNINQLTKKLGGEISLSGDYSSWTYNPKTKLGPLFKEEYEKITKKDAKLDIVHAGLECGVLLEKTRAKDAVSFGPNVYDVHTSKEHLDIASCERNYKLLKNVLKKMKDIF